MAALFHCTSCDAQYPKWQGRCVQCGKWNTITQETETTTLGVRTLRASEEIRGKAMPLKKISAAQTRERRVATGLSGWDTVLGGGLVVGSVVLLSGDPGVGKSTAALQLADAVKGKVMYVAGEESLGQISLRCKRLGILASRTNFLDTVVVEDVVATMRKEKPTVVVVDSIQMLRSAEGTGVAGQLQQMSVCAAKLIAEAKQSGTIVVLIGHVTKSGVLAGPKTLEHAVDVVLYLESGTYPSFRLLRATKNRFGATGEAVLLEMTTRGFIEVKNPANIFLSGDRPRVPGTIVTSIIEGSHAFLVEVQALTTPTAFGYPKRIANGFEARRLDILASVLARVTKFSVQQHDIVINIVGGFKIVDTGMDLAVALAILSSLSGKPIAHDVLAVGEVGLVSEIRPVDQIQLRLKAAHKLGFKTLIVPKQTKVRVAGASVHAVASVAEAVAAVWPNNVRSRKN